MIKAREFESATEMMAFYRDLNRRLQNPPGARPREEPDALRMTRRHHLEMARTTGFRKLNVKPKKDDMYGEETLVVTPVQHEEMCTRRSGSAEKRTARDIVAQVAAEHGVSVADVLGKSRVAQLCACRHAAMAAVAVLRPDFSLTRIGALFGRDHTTVLHALKKHKIVRSESGENTDSVDFEVEDAGMYDDASVEIA